MANATHVIDEKSGKRRMKSVEERYTRGVKIQAVIRFVVCLVITVISLFPIYIILINATRDSGDIISQGISLLPGGNLIKNFETLNDPSAADGAFVSAFNLFYGYANSLIISIGATVCAVFFSGLTAYGLVVYDFKLKKAATTFILAVMMVPMQVTSVGFLQFMIKLGLSDSFIPLIVPTIAAPAIVFFMRQYLKSSFPLDIVEAARIDGCGEFRTFLTIAIPMMKPAIAVQAIFAFIQNWNNFYQPSMILVSRKFEQITMPMMINMLKSNDKIADYGVIYAGIALSIIPVVVIYLLLSRFIVEGVALGGVKE